LAAWISFSACGTRGEGVRVWGWGEEKRRGGGERRRDLQKGEAVVPSVLHLPDAFLESGRQLHPAADAAAAVGRIDLCCVYRDLICV
jgi:hypothetical protein